MNGNSRPAATVHAQRWRVVRRARSPRPGTGGNPGSGSENRRYALVVIDRDTHRPAAAIGPFPSESAADQFADDQSINPYAVVPFSATSPFPGTP